MTRHMRLLAVLGCWCAVQGIGDAQTRANHLLFTDPGLRFSVEFPREWRWMIVAGSGEPIAVFIQPRNEAAVVVEHFRLPQPLGPDAISELFAKTEADYIKEHQPRATDVAARLNAQPSRLTAVIDYTRSGVSELGERERVRQYSIPVAGDLYRVTCIALLSRFPRYEATFLAVADSLKTPDQLGARR